MVVVNAITYMRHNFVLHVVILFLWHNIIHWITVISYDINFVYLYLTSFTAIKQYVTNILLYNIPKQDVRMPKFIFGRSLRTVSLKQSQNHSLISWVGFRNS